MFANSHLTQRGGSGIQISGRGYDPESDRKSSGAGLEDVAKNPTTWVSLGNMAMAAIIILGLAAIAIVFGILIHNASGKVDDLQEQLDKIQAKGTPGSCYDGCSGLVEVCEYPSDCTPLLVPLGTISSTDCYYGMCVYITVPPAFPVPSGVLADDMCAKFLNHTAEPRLPCLAGSTVDSSDMASYCMFLNGCGEYVQPPMIARSVAALESPEPVAEEPVVADASAAPAVVPAASRSVRRAVRK